MTFDGTADDRIPAFVADDRFWNTASPRFAAPPHGRNEPDSAIRTYHLHPRHSS
jgi:hypothetical protein